MSVADTHKRSWVAIPKHASVDFLSTVRPMQLNMVPKRLFIFG